MIDFNKCRFCTIGALSTLRHPYSSGMILKQISHPLLLSSPYTLTFSLTHHLLFIFIFTHSPHGSKLREYITWKDCSVYKQCVFISLSLPLSLRPFILPPSATHPSLVNSISTQNLPRRSGLQPSSPPSQLFLLPHSTFSLSPLPSITSFCLLPFTRVYKVSIFSFLVFLFLNRRYGTGKDMF